MRPTVSEQLEGLRRILAEVVAPAVEDVYPADVLTGVMAALDALAAGWAEVPQFLAWDIHESTELLRAAGRHDAELAARVHALEAAAPNEAFEVHAWEDHHARVRTLLADVAPSMAGGPLADRLTAHLRERADRFPIRVAQRMPGQR
jgi:hypothetical protein